MLTSRTHVDRPREDDPQNDEELPEAEEDQDVVELVVESEAIVVIDHFDGSIREEGIGLQKEDEHLEEQGASFPWSEDGFLHIQYLLALFQLHLRHVPDDRDRHLHEQRAKHEVQAEGGNLLIPEVCGIRV